MSGKILMFGFDSLPEIVSLAAAVKPFGVAAVPVAKQDYSKTIGVLAGLDQPTSEPRPYAGGPLGGRMLVLCDVSGKLDDLLAALRGAGIGPECLKAVLTEHNRRWDPVALHGELLRERQELKGKNK